MICLRFLYNPTTIELRKRGAGGGRATDKKKKPHNPEVEQQ